jgi:hypothetical protein
MLEALTQGMNEYGWIEGQNIIFEYRFGNADVLPKLAVELVHLPVDAMAAARLFDHVVGAAEQSDWESEAERFGDSLIC